MLDYFHSGKSMGGSLGKASDSSSTTYQFQLLTDLSFNFAMFIEVLYKVTRLYLPSIQVAKPPRGAKTYCSER